jgi:hypothetical protein
MKAFLIANMEGDEEFLGMDLRDYFAAKAMQALLFDIKSIQVSMDKTANLSYKFADAMMEARKK